MMKTLFCTTAQFSLCPQCKNVIDFNALSNLSQSRKGTLTWLYWQFLLWESETDKINLRAQTTITVDELTLVTQCVKDWMTYWFHGKDSSSSSSSAMYYYEWKYGTGYVFDMDDFVNVIYHLETRHRAKAINGTLKACHIAWELDTLPWCSMTCKECTQPFPLSEVDPIRDWIDNQYVRREKGCTMP